MPKYLFFLILGAIAIALLRVLKYLRSAVGAKEAQNEQMTARLRQRKTP